MRHEVIFYASEAETASRAADHLVAAIDAGGRAISVATTSRRAAVETELAKRGVPARGARASQLLQLDAAATLRRLLVGGSPDPHAFACFIGEVISRARAATDGPLHVFGEMVGLLWDVGHINGALAIEGMWKELAERNEFSLLCAFSSASVAPRREVSTSALAVAARLELCRLHSALLAGPCLRSAAGPLPQPVSSRSFRAERESPEDSQHYVTDTLLGWGELRLVPDACIVVGELATNAVRHTRRPYEVGLTAFPGGIRVEVRDRSPVPLRVRAEGPVVASGCGIAIVARLAARWGVAQESEGKVVWAELDR